MVRKISSKAQGGRPKYAANTEQACSEPTVAQERGLQESVHALLRSDQFTREPFGTVLGGSDYPLRVFVFVGSGKQVSVRA